MPLQWLEIFQRTNNRLRALSLLLFAMLAGLMLVISLMTARYTSLAFRARVEAGFDVRQIERQLNQLAEEQQDLGPIDPYQVIAIVGRVASAFMALFACFLIACALWLAASLYREGATRAETRGQRLAIGGQLLIFYWAGVALGVLLTQLAPAMLMLPELGLQERRRPDTQLQLVALGMLALLALIALPALVWLRNRPTMNELRLSRRGVQLRAGLIGSVVLTTALCLSIYAFGWWTERSVLLNNAVAAIVTAALGSVGPLAINWNSDRSYKAAIRSASMALFVCLLLTFSFTLIGALLTGLSLVEIEGLVAPAPGEVVLIVTAGYAAAIFFGGLLSLVLGWLSGVVVVAFKRRTLAGDSETIAENTMRIESLLLLCRLLLALVIALFIAPDTRQGHALATTLELYLLAMVSLNLLLRAWPRRLLLWSICGSLLDAAAISTLVAVDGGIGSPFFMLYFLALQGVTMRFSAYVSIAASVQYAVLYMVALVSVEGWDAIASSATMQEAINNRLLLILSFGLLAALLAREHQQALLRLETANQRLLADAALRRELEIARQVQQNLFPSELPRLPGVALAARCLPARETGGDFFDIIERDHQLAVVVADVSGKSVPAAMVMAMARSAFRAEILDGHPPARALTKANITLQGAGRGMFTAAQYALLDTQQRTLTLCNAGQLAPMLRRGDQISLLQPPGPALPLGIVVNGSYAEQTYQLRPGDMLLFYTDGVVEAMDAQRQLYGFDRLEELFGRCQAMDGEQLIEQILCELERFSAGHEQHDDITLVAISLA